MTIKTNGLLLLAMLSLTACISVPIEFKVNPTMARHGVNLSTFQFTEPDKEKAFRTIREFARERRMEALPADHRVLGPGWAQEQYQLKVKLKGFFYDTEHVIRVALLYKDGNATIQLLHDGEIQRESAQIELALLDTLRQQFGANNVTRIGG